MTRSTIKKHTIAVDIDDVIAAQIPKFVEFSNQRYGTNITVDTYTEDWPTLWNVPLEESNVRSRQYSSEKFAEFSVLEHAQPVLRRLAEQYTLIIVTARPAYSEALTQDWINKYFDGLFSDIHFVPIWEPNSTTTKADICRQIGANYLIDDQPKHCNMAAEAGITSLLFGGYEWAKSHDLHKDVVQVDDWQKVAAYFRV